MGRSSLRGLRGERACPTCARHPTPSPPAVQVFGRRSCLAIIAKLAAVSQMTAHSDSPASGEYVPRRPGRDEVVPIRGLDTHLTWWGERNDNPVVLLHGFMDAGRTWQFLVDCLPHSWTCVAPDWRGFGESARSQGPYWF